MKLHNYFRSSASFRVCIALARGDHKLPTYTEVSADGLVLTMAAFDACMRLDAFQWSQPAICPDNEG